MTKIHLVGGGGREYSHWDTCTQSSTSWFLSPARVIPKNKARNKLWVLPDVVPPQKKSFDDENSRNKFLLLKKI